MKQRVAALETSAPKPQAVSASSVPVSSLLLTRWQDKLRQKHRRYKVTPYCEMSGQIPTDFGVCMFAEVDEQPTDAVWILYDAGSTVTVCLRRWDAREKCLWKSRSG